MWEVSDERRPFGGSRARSGSRPGVPVGTEPGRFPAPGGVHLPGQGRGRRWRSAVQLPGSRGALVAARQRAEVGRAGQGRSRRHAAVQLVGHARSAFRRARGGRDPGRGQPPPGGHRDRLYPAPQRRPVPAARHRARGAGRAGRSGRGDRDPLRGHRQQHRRRPDPYEEFLAAASPAARPASSSTKRRRSRSTTPPAPRASPRGCSTPIAART